MKEKIHFCDNLFKDSPSGPHLLGCVCKQCGKVFFPRTDFCNDCHGTEFENKELAREGEIYSYTITRVPVAQYPVPHAIGMISIPEDRVRVVAPLVYDGSIEYHIGEPVEMVIDTLWEDEKIVIGYKFKHREVGVD